MVSPGLVVQAVFNVGHLLVVLHSETDPMTSHLVAVGGVLNRTLVQALMA